jgi:hypothetical protein
MPIFTRVVILFCWIAFQGCDLINRDEEMPAYIAIDSIRLNANSALQGTSSSKITDAWIYVDDNLIGAFELPCSIPVLASGQHKVSIGAGVLVNGLTALRAPYPFYRFYSENNVNLNVGEIRKIEPVVTYFDSLQFAFMANFDDLSGSKLEAAGASDTTIALTSNPELVFEGAGSMIAALYRDSGFIEFQMVEPVELPKQGTTVYLELNYKTSHILNVGLKANYTSSGTVSAPLVSLNPSVEWNKIYINLTRQVSQQVNAANYRVYFYAPKPAGSGKMELFIDNMKIVY